MAVLVTAIHVFLVEKQVVDGRNKSGHDAELLPDRRCYFAAATAPSGATRR
jgi:hypothetical protein